MEKQTENESFIELTDICKELLTLVTEISCELSQTQNLLNRTRVELGRVKGRLYSTDSLIRRHSAERRFSRLERIKEEADVESQAIRMGKGAD